MYTISELLWLKPTLHHLYQRNLKYLPFLIVSLTEQVSARFLDAPAQQFTDVGLTVNSLSGRHRALGFSQNCDQLTDMQTRLRRTPQAGRSLGSLSQCIGGSDVTESMFTIRSPFCGYRPNLAFIQIKFNKLV